jgi:hypothetical protein
MVKMILILNFKFKIINTLIQKKTLSNKVEQIFLKRQYFTNYFFFLHKSKMFIKNFFLELKIFSLKG